MDYPLSGFHFIVEWGGNRVGFLEVTGLTASTTPLEYREGDSKSASVIKIPGKISYTNIVLKRGLMAGDNDFYIWFCSLQSNNVERRDITIQLLDEAHQPVIVWRIKNAFPVRISYSGLHALNDSVAVEELEICHEGMTIENIACVR